MQHTVLTMSKTEQSSQSFLLRMWRTPSFGDAIWHFMLENPHTGERQGFSSLEALVVFLKAFIDEGAPHSNLSEFDDGNPKT